MRLENRHRPCPSYQRTEPPRDSRRLHLLTGWSHDEENTPVFPGGPRAGGPDGFRSPGRVRLAVRGHRSIAAKISCSGETLRHWVRQAERDQGLRPGPTSQEQEKIKALEREVRELRQANEILRKASAYVAQAELDRRSKP